MEENQERGKAKLTFNPSIYAWKLSRSPTKLFTIKSTFCGVIVVLTMKSVGFGGAAGSFANGGGTGGLSNGKSVKFLLMW